jgi:hypothetical protein
VAFDGAAGVGGEVPASSRDVDHAPERDAARVHCDDGSDGGAACGGESAGVFSAAETAWAVGGDAVEDRCLVGLGAGGQELEDDGEEGAAQSASADWTGTVVGLNQLVTTTNQRLAGCDGTRQSGADARGGVVGPRSSQP